MIKLIKELSEIIEERNKAVEATNDKYLISALMKEVTTLEKAKETILQFDRKIMQTSN